MANDVAELTTHIIADLGRADTSLSDIVLIDINSSIRDYEGQRFFFNEQALGPVTLSATNTYALSLWTPGTNATTASDVIEIDSVRVNITNRAYTIGPVSYIEMNDLDENSTSTSGYPQIYTIYNRSIRIYPMPSASITMTATVSAHVKFPDLVLTDANVWTNEAKELIRNATLKRLWGRRFKDYTAAQAAQQAEQDALAQLQRRTSALGGNRIRSML